MTRAIGPGHNAPPPEKPGPYAIYRTAKIKTAGQLAGSANHMTRSSPTPNADPRRAELNEILIGSDDPAADVRALLPEIDQRDADGLLLRRSNSVLAVEVLVTASPEWWAEATPAMRKDWQRATLDWLAEAWGGRQNLAHMRMHGDETTPHLTGYVVPLDERGALNCRSFIGERQQLREQQTGYAEAVAHLGLQRGVPGSKAIHQAVSRYYGALTAPEQTPQVPRPPHLVWSPEEWAAEASAQMMKDLAPTAARAKSADLERTGRKGAETTVRTQNAALEAAKAERQALAAKMRELDLHAVCDALALSWDAQDKVWRGETVKIGIGEGPKAGKWFDYRADRGRGGAIDLAQHVLGRDFNDALAFLVDRFGPGAAAADAAARTFRDVSRAEEAAVKDRKPFVLPEPSPEHWPHVRKHLAQERGLPAGYLDRLHEKGDLYADDRKNAVFVCRGLDGMPVGAELKGTFLRSDGTRYGGLAPGSRKDAGGFRIGSIVKAKAIYLVESAIDAISLLKLRMDAGEREFAVISTAGATPHVREWLQGVGRAVRRICAFDADETGDEKARGLRRNGFERLRPSLGKDWNDELRAVLSSSGESGERVTSQDHVRDDGTDPYPSP
jgi:hypothetical protein